MKKIIIEYHRFIKKQFKQLFFSVNKKEQQKILLELLGIEKHSFLIDDSFITHNYNEQETNCLKENLDEKSKEQVDLLIERIFCPFIRHDFSQKDNKPNLFTEQEIKMQKTAIDNIQSYKKLKNKSFLAESVYRYHSGLKLIPQKILHRLEGKDFIDGGGYLGDSAFIFLEYNPNSVHIFEPNNENFDGLIENIKFLNSGNIITPVKAGIADKTMEINASGTGLSFSILNDEESNVQKIKCYSIDDYVKENKLDLGLIKLDIEGYELEAVKGATETVKKMKPVLLISIYHNTKDFFSIKPYIESLNLNYNFMIRKLDNSNLLVDTMLIGYPDV